MIDLSIDRAVSIKRKEDSLKKLLKEDLYLLTGAFPTADHSAVLILIAFLLASDRRNVFPSKKFSILERICPKKRLRSRFM